MRMTLVLASLLALVSAIAVAAGPTKADLAAAGQMKPGATKTITAGRVSIQYPSRRMNGTIITANRTDVINDDGTISTGRTQRFAGVESGVETTITTRLDGTKTFRVLAPVRPPGYVLGRPPVTIEGEYTPAKLAAGRAAAVTEAARRVQILVNR